MKRRSPRTKAEQREEDLANLAALRDSGSLEDTEAARIADITAELQARAMLSTEATLSPAQRSYVEARVQTLGLRQPTFASGEIPRGKPVDHLEGVPAALRKPAKPPTRRT